MKLHLKKLNSRGVAHHVLIAILVISGFAGFGAWRVFSSSAANTYTFTKPNGCKPGKIKDQQGNCNWYNKVENIKADCDQFHLQFDNSSTQKKCVYNCVAGWFIDDVTGGCKEMQNPPPSTGGGSGGGTTGGQTGGGGETTGGGGGCAAGTVKEGAYCVDWKARNDCTDKHREYNVANAQCSEKCLTGYSKTGGKLPCVKDAPAVSQTDVCATEPARCAAPVEEDEEADTEDTTDVTDTTTDSTTTETGTEANGDGTTEQGGCLTGQRASADGTCSEDVVIEQVINADVSTLDSEISQENCELMGREWESNAKLKGDKKKKVSGCKINVCINKDSKIVDQSNGKPFCKGFIQKIDKSKCSELHRKWLDQVRGCAVRYNQKPKAGATVVKAKECAGAYTTYVYKAGADECLTPSNVQKLKGIAKTTGTPFVKLTNMSKAGICKVRPGVHWNGKRCVKDAPAQPAGSTESTESESQQGNCVVSNTCPPGTGNNPSTNSTSGTGPGGGTGGGSYFVYCETYMTKVYAASSAYRCDNLKKYAVSGYKCLSEQGIPKSPAKLTYLQMYTYACPR